MQSDGYQLHFYEKEKMAHFKHVMKELRSNHDWSDVLIAHK